jgi:Kef-type K+ transport system membrane component KefB
LLLHTLERSAVVMVIFFAASGASLDLASLGTLWPAVLVLGAVRLAGLFGASVGGSKLAGQDPQVGRWAWTAYVAQGALALALAAMVEAKFDALRPGFSGLVLAVLGLNLLLGPVLLKIGLGRSGEAGQGGVEAH